MQRELGGLSAGAGLPSWLWGQLRRNAFSLRIWVSLFLGLIANQTDTPNAFAALFWSGPLHIRILAWTSSIFLLESIILILIHSLSRVADNDIYQPKHRLGDWEMDSRWLGFDGNVEIARAPNLTEPHGGQGEPGWKREDCLLKGLGDFANAPRLENQYVTWRRSISPEKLSKDGTKYTLVNHPSSETDEHFVQLQFRSTKWSRVQACRSLITDKDKGRNELFKIADPNWESGSKPKLNLESSELPHSFCLHGVVITTDNKLLALQRPGPLETDYYPNAWSFSFEEQLADSDFAGQEGQVDVSHLLLRGVRQEVLGEEGMKYFEISRTRILSVAIEEEILNPFSVAYIPVACDSTTLSRILPHISDKKEWQRMAFYTLDPPYVFLLDAYLNNKAADGHVLHPTSRYRIYLALKAHLPPLVFNNLARRMCHRHG